MCVYFFIKCVVRWSENSVRFENLMDFQKAQILLDFEIWHVFNIGILWWISHLIIYLLENMFFFTCVIQARPSCMYQNYITLKIAKTHISPRVKKTHITHITPHVTHINPRAKRPYHLTFLLDQTQSIPYRYAVHIFVCLFVWLFCL